MSQIRVKRTNSKSKPQIYGYFKHITFCPTCFFSQLFEIYELIINIKRMGIAFLGILLLFAFRCMFHYKSYSVFICTNLYFQDQVVVYRLKYHVLYIIQSIKIVLFPVTITFVQIVISYLFLQLLHAVSYISTFGHALEHPLLIMNEFCTFFGL